MMLMRLLPHFVRSLFEICLSNSMIKEPTTKRTLSKFAQHLRDLPIIQFESVSYRYNGVIALNDVTFDLQAGTRLAVVGPNGAGKSTMLKIIAGVLHPTHGEIKVYGHEPSGHICIAYVPQHTQVDWDFPVNVADVVMMGRIRKLGLFHWPKKADWEIVKHALHNVEMIDLSDRQINELSGGQQQRMFIARALAQEAELILMDEPLTGLDVNSQEGILHIIEELHRQGVTVIVALHDLKLAAEQFDRVLLINRRLLGIGSPEDVFEPQRLIDAYGSHLRLISTTDGFVVLEDTCCDEIDHEHN
jgi:manganese/iron transport system ATP-binding protein